MIKECKVEFEDSLTEREIEQLVIAIKMFKGISSVIIKNAESDSKEEIKETRVISEIKNEDASDLKGDNPAVISEVTHEGISNFEKRDLNSTQDLIRQVAPLRPKAPLRPPSFSQPSGSASKIPHPADSDDTVRSNNLSQSFEPEAGYELNRGVINKRTVSEIDDIPDRTNNYANNIASQRAIIDVAIRWGITNGRLSLRELESYSAEEIIDIAFNLIDLMPENEREQLGRNFSQSFRN